MIEMFACLQVEGKGGFTKLMQKVSSTEKYSNKT